MSRPELLTRTAAVLTALVGCVWSAGHSLAAIWLSALIHDSQRLAIFERRVWTWLTAAFVLAVLAIHLSRPLWRALREWAAATEDDEPVMWI